VTGSALFIDGGWTARDDRAARFALGAECSRKRNVNGRPFVVTSASFAASAERDFGDSVITGAARRQ
jgi:hypothetical protein